MKDYFKRRMLSHKQAYCCVDCDYTDKRRLHLKKKLRRRIRRILKLELRR